MVTYTDRQKKRLHSFDVQPSRNCDMHTPPAVSNLTRNTGQIFYSAPTGQLSADTIVANGCC